MNPFWAAADSELRGSRVDVVTNDGTRYRGWVQRLHHNQRHVLLRDAVRIDDDVELGTTFVAHVDAIEGHNDPATYIKEVALDDIVDSPYAAREFDALANGGYISNVRDEGWVGSYPTVRHAEGGFEIVAGHKRIWVARQARLRSHPVVVLSECSNWDAARLFVHDHFPDRRQVDGGETTADGYYDTAQIREATDELVAQWGERAFELPRVDWNADRLGLKKSEKPQTTGTESTESSLPLSAVEQVADETVTATTYEPPGEDRLWDHTDEDDLREAYDRNETLTAAAELFGVSYATVRTRLINAGIHEPNTYDADNDSEDEENESNGHQVGDELDETALDESDDGGDADRRLPDEITDADIETALSKEDGRRNIEDVAEELGLSVTATRTALSSEDYERVIEGARMRGGYR